MQHNWQIIGAPYDLAASAQGASDAPDHLRKHYFRKWIPNFERFWDISVDDGGDIKPEKVTEDAITSLAAYATQIYTQVLNSLESHHTPLILGGDHSISVGTVSAAKTYLQNKHGDKANLGLLWIDAHADMNTNPRGSLHGRVAAFLMGEGPSELTTIGAASPQINPCHFMGLAIRDLMPTERDFLAQNEITLQSMRKIDKMGIQKACENAICFLESNTDGFYLSFDIDAASGEIFEGCATPEVGGLTCRECCNILELAVQSPHFIGMDIVEYCPDKDRNGNTLSLITQMLHTALGYTTQF